jgi:hypothetical protein
MRDGGDGPWIYGLQAHDALQTLHPLTDYYGGFHIFGRFLALVENVCRTLKRCPLPVVDHGGVGGKAASQI